MSNEYEIRSITDLLQFDREQLLRLLPDLIAWHSFGRAIQGDDAEMQAMLWTDDGRPGVIDEVILMVKETDEKICVKVPQ